MKVKLIPRTVQESRFEALINNAIEEIYKDYRFSIIVDIKYQFQDGYYSALIIYKYQ